MKKEITKKPSKYSLAQDEILKKNKPLFTSGTAGDVFKAISGGDNSYLKIRRTETSAFDNTWIDKIEDCIPELEEIVKNPRRNISSEGNVVPVELAKKTNSESVRHLATHTQFVKEIKDNGDVIPSKILTIVNEDDYGMYENRFIATLIRRLFLFVEKRYEFVVEHALLKETEELKMKSKSVVDGSVVEMETKIKIVKPADYDGIEEKNSYVDKIINIRNHLRYCYVSDFMKLFKTDKDVRNPIIMTNIIRKNPTYHKCYLLWRYIETYTSAGVFYSVNDNYLELKQNDLDEINLAMSMNFLAARSNNPSRFAYIKSKSYKPKILRSIDDEEFEYGPYLEGPIEFVRVDEAYRKATETKNQFFIEENVYDKPRSGNEVNKELVRGILRREEEEYIKEMRLENHSIDLMREAKDQLMTRKRHEAAAFDRKAIEMIRNRAAQEREIRSKLFEEERLRQLLLEKEARERLIKQAMRDALDMDKQEEEKKKFEAELEKAAPIETNFTDEELDKVKESNENLVDVIDLATPLEEINTKKKSNKPLRKHRQIKVKEKITKDNLPPVQDNPVKEKEEEIKIDKDFFTNETPLEVQNAEQLSLGENTSKKKKKKEKPVEEPKVEETPVDAPIEIEEVKAEEPVPEVTEPVAEEVPAEEIPVAEEVIVEEPKVEEPAPEVTEVKVEEVPAKEVKPKPKKKRKKRKAKKKVKVIEAPVTEEVTVEEPKVEEPAPEVTEPSVEEVPVEEPIEVEVVSEPVVETPVVVPEPETPVEIVKEPAKPAKKVSKPKKKKPKKKPVVVEKPKPAPVPVKKEKDYHKEVTIRVSLTKLSGTDKKKNIHQKFDFKKDRIVKKVKNK